MSDVNHICDKGLIVTSIQGSIRELYEHKNDHDRRLTEMETTLWGAERHGGGFIKETGESLQGISSGFQALLGTIVGIGKSIERLESRVDRIPEILVKPKTRPEMVVAIAPIVASVLSFIGMLILIFVSIKTKQPIPGVTP